MTKAAHTPGPWSLYSPHPAEQYVDHIDEAGDHSKSIFRIHHDQDIPRTAAEANARLIAAAPELLDCLEELLSDIEQLSDEFAIVREIRDSSYGRAARAALAKAKGGAA